MLIVSAIFSSVGEAPAEPVTLKINVHNPSIATRDVDVRYRLPVEVRPKDVLRHDGLALDYDVDAGCYSVVGSTRLAAHKKKTYEVMLEDKWNVHAPRIATLKLVIETSLVDAKAGKYEATTAGTLQRLRGELITIQAAAGPTKKDAMYIAFHRDQSQRLDRIQEQLDHVQTRATRGELLSLRTTWATISGIILFVAGIVGYILVRSYRWEVASPVMRAQKAFQSHRE